MKLVDSIKYAVFDLDDTLYPELDYCLSGFRAVAEDVSARFELETEEVFSIFWDVFTGGGKNRVFNIALEKLGISYCQEDISCLVELYRSHPPEITLPNETRDVLECLKLKVKLALLTDGYMPAQRLKVQSLAIEDYFDKTVYTELLGRDKWKPSPAGFEEIMRHNKFSPSEYVYIADNPKKDFNAPKQLGWRSVWLKNSRSVHYKKSYEELIYGEFEITSISQLLDIET